MRVAVCSCASVLPHLWTEPFRVNHCGLSTLSPIAPIAVPLADEAEREEAEAQAQAEFEDAVRRARADAAREGRKEQARGEEGQNGGMSCDAWARATGWGISCLMMHERATGWGVTLQPLSPPQAVRVAPPAAVPPLGRSAPLDALTDAKVLVRMPAGPTEQRRAARRTGRYRMEDFGLYVGRKPAHRWGGGGDVMAGDASWKREGVSVRDGDMACK